MRVTRSSPEQNRSEHSSLRQRIVGTNELSHFKGCEVFQVEDAGWNPSTTSHLSQTAALLALHSTRLCLRSFFFASTRRVTANSNTEFRFSLNSCSDMQQSDTLTLIYATVQRVGLFLRPLPCTSCSFKSLCDSQKQAESVSHWPIVPAAITLISASTALTVCHERERVPRGSLTKVTQRWLRLPTILIPTELPQHQLRDL